MLVLLEKITWVFGDDLTGRVFALWGLAFKPNTDDMRDAPSRNIIAGLTQRGARIRAFDPVAMEEARRIYGNQDTLTFANNPEDALKGADALVIVTERTVFRSPDWSELRELLKRPVIFDGRNMFEPARARDHGLEYYCVGRAL